MAILKAFKGIRPAKDKVKQIASRPYDVLSSDEARTEAKDNKYSFLHIVKPEIDLPPDTDHYSPEVYEKGRDNFEKMLNNNLFFRDKKPCLYVYALTMNFKTQIGLVGCAAVEDYVNNVIRKHELTRCDKEEDRKNHVRVSNMNAEPVFFAYKDVPEIDRIMERVMEAEPEYDFCADDDIRHTFWVIDDDKTIEKITKLFSKIPYTYVADGHHRTAAAALVGEERKRQNDAHTGNEEYNYFLAVHFPANQLTIFDYNRVVKDLNGLSESEFLEKLSNCFKIRTIGVKQYRPLKLHDFGLYMNGTWYALETKPGVYDEKDPIDVLDVTILSRNVMNDILNIKDMRTDKRVDFIGGIRGLDELEKRVDSGENAAAFALYPVSMEQLMNIADSGSIMPPKTTWFEPKLRSGLVVHSII